MCDRRSFNHYKKRLCPSCHTLFQNTDSCAVCDLRHSSHYNTCSSSIFLELGKGVNSSLLCGSRCSDLIVHLKLQRSMRWVQTLTHNPYPFSDATLIKAYMTPTSSARYVQTVTLAPYSSSYRVPIRRTIFPSPKTHWAQPLTFAPCAIADIPDLKRCPSSSRGRSPYLPPSDKGPYS